METSNVTDSAREAEERFVKWIPFIGPGAAMGVLFAAYLIFDVLFKY